MSFLVSGCDAPRVWRSAWPPGLVVACACGFVFATGGLGLVQAAIKVPWLLPLVYFNLFVAIAGGGYMLLRGAPARRPVEPAPAPIAGE